MLQKCFYPEPGAEAGSQDRSRVKVGPAPQHWIRSRKPEPVAGTEADQDSPAPQHCGSESNDTDPDPTKTIKNRK